MFASILVLGVLFVARQAKRILKRRGEVTTEINLQGFRDEGFHDDEMEDDRGLGFSPNGNMLFPGAFSSGRSARPEQIMVLRDINLS
jgi:hypothetical protein